MKFDEFVERFRFRKFEPFAPCAAEVTRCGGVYHHVPGVAGLFLGARDRDGSGAVLMGAKWVCNEYWLRRLAGDVDRSVVPPPLEWELPESEFLPPDLRQASATRWLIERDGSVMTSGAYFQDGEVNYASITMTRPFAFELMYGTDETMSDELPVAIEITLLPPDRAPGR